MRLLASLSNRIFLASALLASLSIGAALFFVRARLTSETERALARDLEAAAAMVDDQQAAVYETYTRLAQLVADLPRFKAAVDTGDPPTVQPVAGEYLRQIGADLLEVRDRHDRVLAAVGAPSSGVLRLIDVPMVVGTDRVGALRVGYVLDAGRARGVSALTGAEIAFADGRGVRASTLGHASLEALAGLVPGGPATRVEVDGTDFVALARPLHPERDGQPASVIVMHSRTARLQTLSAIQAFLVALALGAVLLASALSYWVARTVTRPLARLTDHMRHVARSGDLTRRLAPEDTARWYDEDARLLAQTFNHLAEAVARAQREAGQRERLSALGRLSTVMAHEIRNPLMIIKGALRTMTRQGASPDDRRDAAADIEGEIARLDRLVHDVLDFARPIRFDCAPTDLNEVCEDAARAVTANGHPAPSLRLARLPLVVTDRERLRTVLVNLLTNAQQATEGAAAPAAIVVSSETIGAGRVAITVRDAGRGIARDDLPRIFEPYFTTRRGGTGLGLAISRNIVEGLDGSLTAASIPGEGTVFRLEIGDASLATR